MAAPRVGLWLIGACGGVGSTTAFGLAALARGLTSTTGLVTALPRFGSLGLDEPAQFVVGGHDIRKASLLSAVKELHCRSNVFDQRVIDACAPDLDAWSANLRPGVTYRPDPTIAALADRADVVAAATPKAAIDQIQRDLKAFVASAKLDQLVVVNAASTEPPIDLTDEHCSVGRFQHMLKEPIPGLLPTSTLYAYAAIDAGFPYENLTPSRGATMPALEKLAEARGVPVAGQDLKTGETLLKSVLAPMFARRNLKVLSWVGHNILGNRDGMVLNDPQNKASKVKSKDHLLGELLGYKPQSHVSIEYIESLDDWKTAWDHIHFEGFLGTKMTLQFTWQGCDSLLAAPLVLDIARLALLAQRRGESGVMKHLACFFKSPAGVDQHDFHLQFEMLDAYGR